MPDRFPDEPDQPDRRRETRQIVSICIAAAVLPMTFSGGAIATPALAQSFGQNGPMLFWVVNAFMMVFGALPLVAGALADRIGRRRVFRFGLAGFILSGLLLPFSPTLLAVDLLRGLQGLFAAATLSGGTAVLAQLPDPTRRRRAFSMIGATFGFGLAFGPLIAGLALEIGGWRAVFLLASALAALSLALGAGVIPESRSPARAPFDSLGACLFACFLIFGTAWAVLLPTLGAGDAWELVLAALCMACLGAFIWQERRCAAPMFDLTLFQEPAFVAVQSLPVATCFGFVSLLVIVPLQLVGAGYSEISAGLMLAALSAPVFLIPVLLAYLPSGNRRLLVAAGLCVAAMGLAGLAFTPFDGPVWPLLVMLAVIGCGTGLPWGVMDGLAIEVAPREKAGVATGMFSTVRVASEGIVLALVSATLAQLISRFSGIPSQEAVIYVTGSAVPPDLRGAVESACRILFLGLSGVALLSGIFAWRRLGVGHLSRQSGAGEGQEARALGAD